MLMAPERPIVLVGTEPRRARLRALDGLRLLAALSVLAYHFTARSNDAWGVPVSSVFPDLSAVSAYGALGVQLFFVISGFVILLSAWGTDLRHFVASRAGRLFPAYWVAVGLTGAIILFAWQPDGRTITWETLVVNLTMAQTGLGVPHVEGVYWTLWCELRFYLLIGLFLHLGITRERVLALCALWPVVAALGRTTETRLVSEFLMPEYAPFFAGGMLLYLIHREGHSVPAWLLVGLNAVLAAHSTTVGFARGMATNTGENISGATVSLVILGCFGLVALLTTTRLQQVRWRWLTTAGALTYPLYLTHETFGKWVITFLYPGLPARAAVLLAVGACVLLAWAIHRLVEQPFSGPLRAAVQLAFSARPESTPRPGADDAPAETGAVRPEGAVSVADG